MSQITSEKLCEDCPLRQSRVCGTEKINEQIRINLEDDDDLHLVQQNKYGRAILSALRKDRPERCQELRELSQKGAIPAMPRHHSGGINFDECAEVHLINSLVEFESEELGI